LTEQEKRTEREESQPPLFSDLSSLYQAYARQIFLYHYARVQNMQEAEDLTSQTFVAASEFWHTLRDPARAVSWIFTIARNKGIDLLRRNSEIQHEELDDELTNSAYSNNPKICAETQERLLDLRRHIENLTEKEQDLIRLRLVAELPFKQIAEIRHEPETRIKKRYYRLLERLQAQMEQE